MTKKQDVYGAVKIGNGAKLHSAFIDKHYGLIIRCGCPGTSQGDAYKRARFFPGVTPNCKN